MKVKSQSEVAQSCLTLSDPVDCSPPGSSVHGIFQARVLEWGAIAFSDQKLLELFNEFGKVSQYNINIQKSLAFLYTNNTRSEREIKEIIPFIIASKRMKYLRINLLKEAKDLCSENYKMLMKSTKDDRDRWKDMPCSWTRSISIVKMTVLLKAIYRFSVYVLSRVWLFVTPVTLWNFSRQEYWSGLPFPTSRDLPDPGIKPTYPAPPKSPALAGGFFTTESLSFNAIPIKLPMAFFRNCNKKVFFFLFIEKYNRL